jgi:hypothetical protein
MKPIEARPTHRNRVACESQRSAEKEQVANILCRADCAAATPDDADNACRDEHKARFLLWCKRLLQDDGRKHGGYQRHDAGKQGGRM